MRLKAQLVLLLLGVPMRLIAQEPPVIPVGMDAYRQWERWPYQRIGARAYMRSTYDRTGGNEGADASHFLYQTADDFNVSLDVEGPGMLYFVRTNHWHGSPWHYVVDGQDNVVQETSTATPDKPVANSIFLPAAAFPNPLAWTWADTKGADLSWVPIGFTNSFQMAYSRTHYGTGYYIYQQFMPGARLSQPLHAWKQDPISASSDVLALLRRAGTDIAPQPDTPVGRKRHIRRLNGTSALPRNSAVTLIHLAGPTMLRALELSISRAQALELGHAHLRIHWDAGRTPGGAPSIDAPVALFFGAGTLYNQDNREFLVKALPVNVRFDRTRVHLACYFPMPFFRSATIELVGAGGADLTDVQWSVRTEPLHARPDEVGYFHATYQDHPHPELGKDLVLLDTRTVEGGGDWAGHLVGTSFIFSHNANLGTLEGDPRFFFDDSRTPQAYGTGTEEWGGGGDYWGGQNMTLPLAGHPTGAPDPAHARDPEDKIESAYRFLLADLMPFGKNARIQLEHGGTNESQEHYETVTYWYGAHHPALLQTDELHVGDPESERTHSYHSPTASAPYSLTSRYEWGVDTLHGQEIYPAETDVGRSMQGVSEFNLHLSVHNIGVLLRRKLDYSFPNQRAEVYIAQMPKNGDNGKPIWKKAGVWYLAGSNTCVYSNPRAELGETQHIVQTSNRRFRDDEFLLPRALTEHRTTIRVQIRFTPVSRPLFPGAPPPSSAWSEFRYTAYCYRLPTP
ncbi:MAG: hypothetical protein JWL77_3163 [Chthonomonadaceae bacterium]|nr:hypothetical protein [Chthonomonadaceae bacterium]